jgi:hypothetical protein
MTTEEKYTEQEGHKKFAVDSFNLVWTLLDKENRTLREDDEMIHAAHASRFHWGKIGTALNFARGEWQISRVYSVLNRPQAALYHAKRCLALCTEHDLGDFDLAFAHEAMARAHAVAGETAQRDKHVQLARQAGERVEDKDSRDYLLGDLETIPS